MEPQELIDAKLKALEAEAAKNIAEKIKIEKETEEINKRLEASFLGISFSSYLKTLVAGLVAGALIWTVTVDYPGKILSAHKNIKEINKIKDEKEAELKEVEKELERKNLNIRQKQNQFAEQVLSEVKNDSEIERKDEIKKAVAQVHDIENQQSDLPGFKTLKQDLSFVDTNIKTGWLYLGEFRDGNWINKHFNFSKKQDPSKLNGKTIQLTSQSINVRTKKLTGDIVKILKKGEKVEIIKVKNYPFTNYVWAEIEL